MRLLLLCLHLLSLSAGILLPIVIGSQESDANALCSFKLGITNWPPTNSTSNMIGWECNGTIAMTAPCGLPGTSSTFTWYGLDCDCGTKTLSICGLSLASKSLQGTISSSMSVITGLTYLKLNGNRLSGTIPPELSVLTKLYALDLSSNKLTGSIPYVISALGSSLIDFQLQQNRLAGTIPSQISALGPFLKVLSLSQNSLSETIPSSLSALMGLTSLDLSGNRFSNTIPHQISALTRLTSLYLNDNSLIGSIPSHFSTLRNLQSFQLNGNRITGQIPPEIIDMSNNKLKTLELQNNELTGYVGLSLCHSDYDKFYIQDNNINCIVSCIASKSGYRYDDSEKFTYSQLCGQQFRLISSKTVSTRVVIVVSALSSCALVWAVYSTKLKYLILVVLPFVDVLSDLLYVLSADFFFVGMFCICVFFYLLPGVFFMYDTLYVEKLVSRPLFNKFPMAGNVCWLTPRDRLPMVNGQYPSYVPEMVDDFYKILFVVFVWLFLFAWQLITWLSFGIWTLFFDPAMIFWTAFGIFSYHTKLLAFTPVWNFWVSHWTGNSKKHEKNGLVDLTILNRSLFYEFVFESTPQIIIQFVNGSLLQSFEVIGYISLSMSILFAINGLYTFGYYLYYKEMPIDVVPTFLVNVDSEDVATLIMKNSNVEVEMCNFGANNPKNKLEIGNTSANESGGVMVLNPLTNNYNNEKSEMASLERKFLDLERKHSEMEKKIALLPIIEERIALLSEVEERIALLEKVMYKK